MTREKTGGRKKGTPNKLTSELRSILKDVLSDELEKLPETLEALQPKERIEMIIKLVPYVLPKVESVKMDRGEPVDWGLNSL